VFVGAALVLFWTGPAEVPCKRFVTPKLALHLRRSDLSARTSRAIKTDAK
jgi:hypothetical protein